MISPRRNLQATPVRALALLAGLWIAGPAAAGPATIPGSIWSAEDTLKIKVKGDLIEEKSKGDAVFTLYFGPQTTDLHTLSASEMEMRIDTESAEEVTFVGTYTVDARGRPAVSFAVTEVESVGDEVIADIAGTALESIDYTLDLSKLKLKTKTREKNGVEKFKPKLKMKFDASLESGGASLDHKVVVKFKGRGLKTAP